MKETGQVLNPVLQIGAAGLPVVLVGYATPNVFEGSDRIPSPGSAAVRA